MSDEVFMASNGIRVQLLGNGSLAVNDGVCLPGPVSAMREFFQHERDVELGRWRWPENPNIVVVPDTDGYYVDGKRWVSVYDERKMGRSSWYYSDRSDPGCRGREPLHDAAHDYFAAHPVRKPWHDAKPGEVWAVTVGGEEAIMTVFESQHGGNRFRRNDHDGTVFSLESPTAGRRIWPEATNEW